MISETIKNWIITTHNRYKSRFFPKTITLVPLIHSRGNVLLSYITQPFNLGEDDPTFYSHTNQWECKQIANTWVKHGYIVDIIDWDNATFLPKKDYSVFIDIHSNMERIAPLLGKNCKKILHITGAHWRFQNNAENKRLSALKGRKGITLQPRRQVPPSLGIEYADCATILGNAFTQGTFAYSKKSLYPIPLSTTVQFPFFENKEFDKIRNNFLWFGSPGMVHKGLDLVLESFSELPEYHLTICGPVEQESDFEKIYYKELYQLPNIKTLGFTDVRSDQFHKIIENTCALIYPSCSEGQAGSVITCLHAGLIPVISYESGVDVEDFGIILKESSINEIINAIREISQKKDGELKHMSKKAHLYAKTHHTRKNFADCYDRFVKTMISDEDRTHETSL
jgi:glycosyltransferase involved in cell wall biosynthesis